VYPPSIDFERQTSYLFIITNAAAKIKRDISVSLSQKMHSDTYAKAMKIHRKRKNDRPFLRDNNRDERKSTKISSFCRMIFTKLLTFSHPFDIIYILVIVHIFIGTGSPAPMKIGTVAKQIFFTGEKL
jgi:hypothetical protein